MRKRQTNTINTCATSKQVRKSTDRELTKEELEQIVGGLSLNFTKVEFVNTPISTPSADPPAKHWFNGG
jgi:bacteriocin-like protein